MADTVETPTAAPTHEEVPAEGAHKAAPVPADGASEPTKTEVANGEAEAPAALTDASAQPADTTADLTSDTKHTNAGASDDMRIANELNGAAAPAAPTNGTTNAANKKEKRKSTAGVPEHKTKKNLNRKKSMPDLHLNVEPGQYWFCVMKGFKPWPAIVCDEEMLPESLLMKRPVSAMRPDGTYREDFMEGGKAVRDRRYPVMFLGTNEFAWQVNTDLLPLDIDEVKRAVENNESAGKNKALWSAYEVAAEQHDLDHFKSMLAEHENTLLELRKEEEEKEAKKAEVAEKKAKRKSTTAADADTEMEDAPAEDAPKKAKASKKRKAEKEGEVDAEDKPMKTPKKLKIKAPASPKEESAAKPKKAPKPKKPKAEAEPAKPAKVAEPELTPEQALEKKSKTILFLRHKLQKGFLSRDQAPKADEMPQMHENLSQLQTYPDLEASIIKTTKINKVLKGIIKLATIPREEEFDFKKRCNELLAKWNTALSADDSAPGEPAAATNGVAHEEKAKSESVVPSVEPAAGAEEHVKADEPMKDVPAPTEPATATA